MLLKKPAFAFGVLAMLFIVASCSIRDGNKIVTTNDIAHQKIVFYMQQSIDSLPSGFQLSTTIPGDSSSRYYALPGPLNHDDSNAKQPYNWELTMWIIAPPNISNEEIFNNLRNSWKDRKYKLIDSKIGKYEAETSDGYHMVLDSNADGTPWLSIWSPAFPHDQVNENMSWPSTFTHSHP